MPFYEYECSKCGFRDEVLQSISDAPLKKCPQCGKSGLRKLMSAPVFRLKGSGWYETDFKSDQENKRNLAGAEKEEPKSDAKADAAKPDAAKPEARVDKAESGKAEGGKAQGEKTERGKSEGGASESKPAAKPVRAVKRTKPKAAPRRKARR